MSKGLPQRSDNFSAWYNELVKKADLAENSAVRGCMVIKPYGFSIWEKMQNKLDEMFKETGHKNAYFPLFIPKSYLSKEADHVDGFAKECAVVTHYRLKSDEETGGVVIDPEAKLDEELIIRPTSETVIWNTYKNWIQSYRDLPLLVNQWANVVRWEMRTRLFLRTSEFLWQEGHTAHETKKEAEEETLKILDIYTKFLEETMAVPVLRGIKSENEKFAGAVDTYCVEALMQDGKALQAGTSHFLGQNFAKAFDVKFATKEGKNEYVWGTSWGVSTRLVGALIMSHSDDKGLVLPPNLAPIQVILIPIFNTNDEYTATVSRLEKLDKNLKENNIRSEIDSRENHKPGWKFSEYEMKGVPIRIVLGPKDLENNTVEIARRDELTKNLIKESNVTNHVKELLPEIQNNLYDKAKRYKEENTRIVNSYEEFKNIFKNENGLVYAHWDGSKETEEKIKNDTKATIRCIPISGEKSKGKCIVTGRDSERMVVFGKAY
ncbi:MAG: proline--tRNA ligase [Flammeovirgaceae bacterium]|nr:proline--tRNA ligase [Flammeovirgaceae bacterium]|tara:strand:- start:2298 stop:3773 length:1476 start_codon:yes stop_codon:yes gene_type:complete